MSRQVSLLLLLLSSCTGRLPQQDRKKPEPSTDEARQQAILEWQKKGVRVVHEDSDPLKPVHALRGNGTATDDTLLARLKYFPELRELLLCSTLVADVGLVHLKNVPHVDKLDLSFTKVHRPPLGDLRELRELNLAGTPVDTAGIEAVAALKELERLDLAGTTVTSADLKLLQGLTNLRYLNATGTRVQQVPLWPQLQTLLLARTPADRQPCHHFRTLKSLRYLDLRGTEVTGEDLDQLAMLPHLETLVLSECPQLTRAGLAAVAKLPALRRLYLAPPTPFPEPTATDLRKARPDLTIVR